MKLWTDSFQPGSPIPTAFAFCKQAAEGHVAMSDNRSPHLAWDELPPGTRSLALVCVDPDVPSRPDDVNQEGRMVPMDLPRVDFYHWLVVDLPPEPGVLPEGRYSDGIVPRGKPGPSGPGGTRVGVNDYTGWFASDEEMSGTYFGYDGPCPPWNDSVVHTYRFTLYALDVDRAPVDDEFQGADLMKAIEGHVLDQASIEGTFTLNPRLG